MAENNIIIDLTYLHSLTEGNKSFEQTLLSCTIDNVDSMVNNLRQSWEDKEIEDIKQTAHSLISLSAIAGMPQVEGWCRKIEETFKDGKFHSEMSALVNQIVSGWPFVHVKLKEVIEGN